MGRTTPTPSPDKDPRSAPAGRGSLANHDKVVDAYRKATERAQRAEGAIQRVRAVALGWNSEEWVRRSGQASLVAASEVLEALDDAE